jgi:acetylornithine deacetylase/succinyl-diaminopimelate desuccinylase-like protein
VNAVEKSYELMTALLNLKERVTKRQSKIAVSPDTGLKFMVPRLNINMIHGGLKVNIVPDECVISIDRRLIPEENLETAEQELMEALNSVKGVEWEITQGLRIPTIPSAEGPEVDRLEMIIDEVTGKTGKYGEMGSGDLSVIVCREWEGNEFGIGVIRTECNIHGKDEFVHMRDVESLAEIISIFLSR